MDSPSNSPPLVLAALAGIADDGRHALLEQLWPARDGATAGED